MKYVGFDLVSAALEEKIRQARFYVAQHDEGWGYVMDRAMEPGDAVLSTALPIDEAVRRVSALRARSYQYMWMKTGADAYLGFGSAVVHRPSCGGYLLVMTPTEHASWQLQRLQSGLENVFPRTYDTAAEALVELAEGHALGIV